MAQRWVRRPKYNENGVPVEKQPGVVIGEAKEILVERSLTLCARALGEGRGHRRAVNLEVLRI